jgi:uncharacterized Zn finger protein
MEALRKKGKTIEPVEIEGRTIARSFWGKGWCDHLESFSDFENRLPRGRTYVRNGSVCHLAIEPGHIEAIVSGSSLYKVSIKIKKLAPDLWRAVNERCSGQVGSMLELLQGKLSDHVMAVVTDRAEGLFPQPREIELSCSCPDWATMCKHVAAALYGVGSRLDHQPELLFLLRDVDAQELISTEMAMPQAAATGNVIESSQLADIFGIEMDAEIDSHPGTEIAPPNGSRSAKRPPPASAGKKARSLKRRSNTRNRGQSTAPQDTGRKRPKHKKTAKTTSLRSLPPESHVGDRPRIRPTGKSVARLRKQLGLSVPQFAQELHVSAASIYRWEATTGRLKLQAHTLLALAEAQREARSSTRKGKRK